MAPVYKGDVGTSTTEYSYHPDRGWEDRIVERGTPAWVAGRVPLWQGVGYNVVVNQAGPYAELLASKISATAQVSYIERWSVENEILEKDIFSRPAVMAEALTFPSANGGKAGYKKGIEEAVENGTTLPSEYTGFTKATWVREELARGATSYETEYAILTKELSLPIDSVLNIQLASTATIYETAQLQSVEAIPSSVKFSLPDAPAPAESQTLWGWRVRDQEAEIQLDTRVILRQSWVFAQWSTFLYTPYVP